METVIEMLFDMLDSFYAHLDLFDWIIIIGVCSWIVFLIKRKGE